MVGFDRWYEVVGRSGSAYRRLLDDTFGRGQFVGQQGFASRDQILSLARALVPAGKGPLLDVCCGAGGPAQCIAARLGVQVVGLDLEVTAVRLARIPVVAGDALRLPFAESSFGAALVLDSLSSISAPDALFGELARVLEPGAGLGLTAEVGQPLTSAESARFTRSAPPTVLPLDTLRASLAEAGFCVREVTHHTRDAARVAQRLASGLAERRPALAAELGPEAVDDLATTLACLADLLSSARIAEVVLVARRS
jgi:SAM-dependent methyltransferase